jgi:hypothetical protein
VVIEPIDPTTAVAPRELFINEEMAFLRFIIFFLNR